MSRLDTFIGTELFSAEQPVTVGRHRSSQLRLVAENVSREHITIAIEDGVLIIEDLGSANGTLVNRRRVAGRVEVRPSDAIQVGPYTLRLRALLPQPERAQSDISELDTKVDAVLTADGSNGTDDAALAPSRAIDWRVYEEAIRRATGGEPAKNVIHLKVVPGRESTRIVEPMDDDEGSSERRATARASASEVKAMAREGSTTEAEEPRTNRALEIDTGVVARMEELDRLVERMSDAPAARVDTTPDRPGSKAVLSSAEVTPAEIDEPVWGDESDLVEVDNEPSLAQRFEIVPRQSMVGRERDALETVSNGEVQSSASTEVEAYQEVKGRYPSLSIDPKVIARQLMAPAGTRDPQERMRDRISARLVTPVPGHNLDRKIPPPPPIPTPPPPIELVVKKPPRAASKTPDLPPPLPSRVAAQPRAALSSVGTEQPSSPTRPSAPPPAPVVQTPVERTPSRLRMPPKPSLPPGVPAGSRAVVAPASRPSISPAARAAQVRAASGGVKVVPLVRSAVTVERAPSISRATSMARGPLAALLQSHAELSSGLTPMPREPSMPGLPRPKQAGPSTGALEMDPTEQVPEGDMLFDGIEIVARAGDRLLDISTLRRDGEQYVLGHKTPQGALAPSAQHPGLRLVRITDARLVDLVFPKDVAGHLVRDGETVMLRELTEGRKYSCLRLKARDVVTVMLGEGSNMVSYHVRFIRTPRSISRARSLIAR
ncbi:MAG: FHA domain-containing protein [Myxococcota bacterium]